MIKNSLVGEFSCANVGQAFNRVIGKKTTKRALSLATASQIIIYIHITLLELMSEHIT